MWCAACGPGFRTRSRKQAFGAAQAGRLGGGAGPALVLVKNPAYRPCLGLGQKPGLNVKQWACYGHPFEGSSQLFGPLRAPQVCPQLSIPEGVIHSPEVALLLVRVIRLAPTALTGKNGAKKKKRFSRSRKNTGKMPRPPAPPNGRGCTCAVQSLAKGYCLERPLFGERRFVAHFTSGVPDAF